MTISAPGEYVIFGDRAYGRGPTEEIARLNFRHYGGRLHNGYSLWHFPPELEFASINSVTGEVAWNGDVDNHKPTHKDVPADTAVQLTTVVVTIAHRSEIDFGNVLDLDDFNTLVGDLDPETDMVAGLDEVYTEPILNEEVEDLIVNLGGDHDFFEDYLKEKTS